MPKQGGWRRKLEAFVRQAIKTQVTGSKRELRNEETLVPTPRQESTETTVETDFLHLTSTEATFLEIWSDPLTIDIINETPKNKPRIVRIERVQLIITPVKPAETFAIPEDWFQ